MIARRILSVVGKYGTLLVLVLMIVVMSILAPTSFATPSNFMNILNQVSIIAIVAAGLTFPLVVGQFDMSIGYLASFAGVLCVGMIVNQGLNDVVAIVFTLCVGALVGLVNGVIVTQLRVNALIATLGIGTVLIGVNYAYSGGIPISGLADHVGFTAIAQGNLFGIPLTIVYMVLVLGIFWVILNRTVLGQQMQAVGGNARAASLSGVRVNRVRTWAFVLSGLAAAIGGILLSSRIGSGQVTGGDGYLLQSFAAVFLGSAALRDGEFHIIGTFIGVLTVGVGFNGIAILGAPTFVQFIFQGVLLVAAVALGTTARRFSTASSTA